MDSLVTAHYGSAAGRPRRASWSPRGLILLAAMVWLTGCKAWVRSTYPEESGPLRVPALSEQVTIRLNSKGVPHIVAKTGDDAATAIGYMHGRDRSFQLEMIRLASLGRLSELLGSRMLDTDRRLRLLSYQLEEAVANLSAADRARIEAYCRGVNLAFTSTPKPFEFRLLGHQPERWTTAHVVAVGRFQAWDLSTDAEREAVRDRVSAAVASKKVFDWLNLPSLHVGMPILDSETTSSDRPVLPDVHPVPKGTPLVRAEERPAVWPSGGATELVGSAPDELRVQIARWTEGWLEGEVGGSNGWAIAGSRTVDGHAILAGDPHLDLGWPATFYEVHYQTPEVDVSGATFPGLPMVVIGRAKDVAWTLTTSYADQQDLFRLKVDVSNPLQYEVDGTMEAFKIWPQTFRTGKKAEDLVTENFRISRFGPVYNAGRESRLLAGQTYALSWPGFSPERLPLVEAFEKLYKATTPAQVIAAVELLPYPSQNWIFVTGDNQIGYVLGGQLPSRRASPLPLDGSLSTSAWNGWLSSADRPRLVDPPTGIIVASNQPVRADATQFNWYAGGTFRALRIGTLLESQAKWSAEDLRGMQLDSTNLEAAWLLPRMVTLAEAALEAASPGLTAPPERIRNMLNAVRGWKFDMNGTLAAPLIYESWRGHLHRLLVQRHVADPAIVELVLKHRLSEGAVTLSLTSNEGAAWFDDPATASTEGAPEEVLKALYLAEQELVRSYGEEVRTWQWGRAHTLTLAHPFASQAILRGVLESRTMPMDGGRHCILALDHQGVLGDYKATSGPALRMVAVEGGDAGFCIPGGNAGHPFHPHAFDQLEDWISGRQHLMSSPPQGKPASSSEIVMVPSPP